MKMVKSLLLGSAAGVVAVAGAQAADLPVKAKPVEYVKICSLYGDGFWYIPGTETCVRLGGSTQGDIFYNARGNGHIQVDAADGARDRTSSPVAFRSRADIGVDSRTQTAFGTLRAVVQFRIDNSDQGSIGPNTPRAYIQWAGFTFGHTKSYTDPVASWGGGSDYKVLHQGTIHDDSGANGTNQIAYTWELGNGMVLIFGADERRVNSVSNLSLSVVTAGTAPTSSRNGMLSPNPYVAWRGSQAWGSWSAAIMAVNTGATYYTVNPLAPACAGQPGTSLCDHPDDKFGFAWMSGIEFKLPMIAQGDRIGFFFNYGVGSGQYTGGTNVQSPATFGGGNQVALGVKTDAVYVNGGGLNLTTSWTLAGAFEHYWMPNVSSTVYGGRASIEYSNNVINSRAFCGGGGGVTQKIVVSAAAACDPSFKQWEYGIHTDWYPVPGFRLAAEVGQMLVESAFSGQVVTLTAVPAGTLRPTGAYLAKNQTVTWVSFKAQRGFGGIGE